MSGTLYKLRTWWETAERSQKMVTLGGIAFFVILLAGTFMFASKPKMVMLYGGLTDTDKASVVSELQAKGIQVNYDAAGTVEVPENSVQTARMALASGGKVPKSAHVGIEGLDKMGLMTTPAQEKERLKSILEGELAKTVESYENIQAARVHITLGDTSPFIQDKKSATASVSITEAGGASVTSEQGRAIATLVASSTPGMDVKDVSVVNQRMEFVFDGRDADSQRNVASNKLEMEDSVAKRKERGIQQTLDAVFGTSSTVVTVACEIDLDKQKVDSTVQTPSEPLVDSKVIETMPVAGAPGGGTGAPASVDPSTPAAGATGTAASSYTSSSTEKQRLPNVTNTQTEKATGSIKSMVINVLANSDKIKPEDQAKLTEFLQQEVANKSTDKVNFPDPKVSWVKFDVSSTTAATKATQEAAGAARMQQIFSLLPIGALMMVAFMVVRTLGKFAGKGMPSSMTISGMPSLNGQALENANNLLAAIEGANHGLALNARGAGGAQLSAQEEEELLVESIKNRVHVPLEQIKKMAAERPHVVGMLLKSMLLEDRR